MPVEISPVLKGQFPDIEPIRLGQVPVKFDFPWGTFADDMFLLLQQKHWLYFGLYVGLSFILYLA